MNKDEINRAIAEAYGWTYHPFKGGWQSPIADAPSRDQTPPDYTACLNACHKIEKALTYEQCYEYQDFLDQIGVRDYEAMGDGSSPSEIENWSFHASAPQRCEAFLRTLSLWKDEQPPAPEATRG